MENDNHDKIYEALMELKIETAKQSVTLNSLDTKVGIQNGRVTSLEKVVAELKELLANYKGKMAIISAVIAFIASVIIALIARHTG